MTRSRYLMGGTMPRRFTDQRSILGTVYRRHYRMLEQDYGGFPTESIRQAAADAAQAFVVKLAAVKVWETAQTARANGNGRRPSERDVIRYAKRVALEGTTYTHAINRLEALLKRTAPEAKPSVAHLFAKEPQPA